MPLDAAVQTQQQPACVQLLHNCKNAHNILNKNASSNGNIQQELVSHL
jgi:hypothetical protein